MANPEHVEIVRRGAEAIAEWRKMNPAERLDLSSADLSNANLRNANLSHAQLTGADLSRAHLICANLFNANLSDANLSHADLSFANLSNANLNDANLHDADLIQANLSGANLSYANLCNANLNGTRFRRSLVYSTIWGSVDLSVAKGLEDVQHRGPSTLGVDTLMLSKGQIPDVFLRGCGLSNDFIAYIPSLFSGSVIDFYSCFISYSHEDKAFARRLHDGLQGRCIRCWLDEKQLLPGDDIYEAVDRGVRVWDKVLLCASKHSLTSWWVDKEINTAFQKEQKLFKERKQKVLALIPLDLDGYMFAGWESGKKADVTARLAADFRDWKNHDTFEEQLEKVVQALRTDDAGKPPSPKPKL